MSRCEKMQEHLRPVRGEMGGHKIRMDSRDGPTEIAEWTAEMSPETWGWTAEMEPKRSEWTTRDGHERSTIVWRLE